MKGFEDVKISWKGVEYTIPANKVLLAVADIEDSIRGESTRPAVQILTQPPGPSYPRIAMGYGAALKAAGAPVTSDEVYLEIMEGFAKADGSVAALVQEAIFMIISIMAPPIARALVAPEEEGEDEKKNTAAE